MKRCCWMIWLVIGALVLAGCIRPAPQAELWRPWDSDQTAMPATSGLPAHAAGTLPALPPTRAPGERVISPTPNPPKVLPTIRTDPDEYIVQTGDTLGKISKLFDIAIETLIEANGISNPNLISAGQTLIIPVPSPQATGSSFKIIPDSELVFGPMSATLDVFDFVKKQGGFLSVYYDTDHNGETFTGAEIIMKVAREYSVNPRLLLVVLEYASGWVTQITPKGSIDYPLTSKEDWRVGLYSQLSWAANQLNRGYYLWQVNGISHWLLADGGVVPAADTINPGTAGVQNLLEKLYSRPGFDQAVSPQGVFAVYERFFGYPFDYAIEFLLPADLSQPEMQLPFEDGKVWSFTGGPHAGWGDGSAWAALDFAPPGGGWGCVLSDEWVTAAVDGLVVRSETGVVVQDLDGDGLEQTGWTLLYLHISSTDRIAAGSILKAGDRIGYPSCEGGESSGTHVHIARRYNGEWIPADQALPFNLDGWISQGAGVEYNGKLIKNGVAVEALDHVAPENQISR